MLLATCQWITEHLNCLISGPTGIGKTWLACALAHKAAREGYRVLYARLPKLFTALDLGRADGRYPTIMKPLAKAELLVERETPRLCRGGSSSLTDAGVHQGNSQS